MSTKQNLPYNMASEQQQLNAYYLQQGGAAGDVPLTTVGQITFTSNSSQTFYSTALSCSANYSNLGESGMLQILQSVLASYEITANDFNYKLDQSGSTNYSVDTTNTNSYAITLTPAPTVLTAGMHVKFAITYGNTLAATLNVNGLGAKNIVKNGGAPLVLGDLLAGCIVDATFDGSNWQIIPSYVAQIAKYTGNAEVLISDGGGSGVCAELNSTYIIFAQDKNGPNYVFAMGYRYNNPSVAPNITIIATGGGGTSGGGLSINTNSIGTVNINNIVATSCVMYVIRLPWGQNGWS